jgi:hypothetical protein
MMSGEVRPSRFCGSWFDILRFSGGMELATRRQIDALRPPCELALLSGAFRLFRIDRAAAP